MFCWPCIIVYQYSETNVMHFLFSLLRIKGLYMFRALLHLQEALHKRHLVYCVRVTSVGGTNHGAANWHNIFISDIHLNIILPSTPGSPHWSLSLRFPHQNPAHASPLPHTRYMPHPSHSFRFYHPHNIGWGVQIMKLLIMKFSPHICYVVPLRPKYSPQRPSEELDMTT
jgi:hypothetical protein